jgi:small conductance mechanosensitive channel
MPPTQLLLDLAIRYGFQVLGAIAILVVAAIAARWIGGFTDHALEKKAVEPPMRRLITRVVKATVLLLAGVVALDKFGFQIAPLVAGIGVAGLGVGFALQGVLGNLIAGLTIIFSKPFRVGEYIEILGVSGEVIAIELFSTTLVHPDHSRVVIPNRKIVGEILHNYGAMRQLDLTVGIAYGTDVSQALVTLREVMTANARVLKHPAPVVGVTGLGDSAITIGIRPWVLVADYIPARAEIYQAVMEGLRARDIDIPFPQREVHLRSAA